MLGWLRATGFRSGRVYHFKKSEIVGVGEPLDLDEVKEGSVPLDKTYAGATVLYVSNYGRVQVQEKADTIMKEIATP